MNMITEIRSLRTPRCLNNEYACSIVEMKQLAGEFFDSAFIVNDWTKGLCLVWERPETQAEMDERLARSAKTKANVKRNMLEQVAAIEKRIEKEQHKLQSVKKTLAEHYSDC